MAESDNSTIVGLFEDEVQADKAVNDLHSAGFSDDQIDLVIRSTGAGDEDILADKQSTGTDGYTTGGAIPTVIGRKPEVTRIVVTVRAVGREQEAVSILHRNGANNANIPLALESDLAPILGTETDNRIP